MKKAEKVFFVENLTEQLKGAKAVVLVNFAGLSVKNQQELKARLAESGSAMIVVKNTLLKRAGEAAKIDPQILTDEILSGQTALIVSDSDPIAPIQVLGKFIKEFEVPSLKVGIVDGSFQDRESLTKLTTLPSKDVLLSQVLGALMSPMYGLTGTLSGGMQKLVYILDQKSKS